MAYYIDVHQDIEVCCKQSRVIPQISGHLTSLIGVLHAISMRCLHMGKTYFQHIKSERWNKIPREDPYRILQSCCDRTAESWTPAPCKENNPEISSRMSESGEWSSISFLSPPSDCPRFLNDCRQIGSVFCQFHQEAHVDWTLKLSSCPVAIGVSSSRSSWNASCSIEKVIDTEKSLRNVKRNSFLDSGYHVLHHLDMGAYSSACLAYYLAPK